MSGGLIVIGSGPAALAAAKAYRERRAEDGVRLISADESAPYNRPPLSKDYLRGESEEDALPLEEAAFYAENRIDLQLNSVVSSVDVEAKLVRLEDGMELPYDTLVLATGARPKPLPVPGATDSRVHQLRSLKHSRSVRAAAVQAARVIVIGSGFIGCEAAASLAIRGTDVTLITNENLPQGARLGEFAGRQITRWLQSLDVTVITGAEITAIREGRSVEMSGRDAVHADLILVAGGIDPNSELAADADLAVDGGRIVVDASMRTSVSGVYAAGDVVRAENPTAGRALTVEHWGEADAMGEVAGTVAAGGEAQWDAVPGFWSEIGEHTLKYAAWGDGFDEAHAVDHGQGAFTVWYSRDGVIVGVLTHEADDEYERGSELVAEHAATCRANLNDAARQRRGAV